MKMVTHRYTGSTNQTIKVAPFHLINLKGGDQEKKIPTPHHSPQFGRIKIN